MGSKRRDSADLAAIIEQGISRGLDVVDAFMSVAAVPKASRALAREHQRAVQAQQRILRRHERRVARWRRQLTGGAVIAGATGSIGILDLAVESGGTSGVLGPWPMWVALALLGTATAIRAGRKLRTAQSPVLPALGVAPPTPLPRSAVGAAEVSRFIAVRLHLVRVAASVDVLYPGAGDELRQADAQAAGPLTALAERLALLHHIAAELPQSSAGEAARESAQVVRVRLAAGCETYEGLLAAAARLLAAPDLSTHVDAILDPAVQAMVAYAHGLQRASDLME